MSQIITLTGPAHCGKSTICNMFMDARNDFFDPVQIPKYTTRPPRKNDEDVICVNKIPGQCDLVYEQYGVRYGIELETLYKHLEEGKSPIIVLNDIRAVEDMKLTFGNLVLSLFLYRTAADYDEFYREESERAKLNIAEEEIQQTARTRYEKAQAIYRIYIENITLFDKVIVNAFDRKYTKIQVDNIIKGLQDDFNGLIGGM